MNDLNFKIGAQLDSGVDAKIQKQLSNVKGLHLNVNDITLSNNALSKIQSTLDNSKVNLNIRSNLNESGLKVQGQQLGQSIGKQISGGINNNITRLNLQKINVKSNIDQFLATNTKLTGELRNQFLELKTAIDSVDDNKALANVKTQLSTLKNEAKSAGMIGKSLGDSFKGALGGVATWLTATTTFFALVRGVKSGISTVRELDTALVDLRKTTNATSRELEEFYYSANTTAKQLGVTTAEVINAASSWSRLGYSIKDASTMAKTSAIFASISPEMNIDQATDGLVSAMKAFNVEADGALDQIASKINAIGNTQAVDNNDLVNIVTRAASAMAAANNTLEQTIALGTAATEITRDAESTGTALKTISMRIRGYDEETESYTSDLENLSGTIADLTKSASTPGGISLFTDETKETYKSTYEIIKDISSIWGQLTDKNQAQLLEALAGKRQGNVVAAMISNFGTAEKSMQTMTDSQGNAMKEMEVIYDSMDYKLNKFGETWTSVAQNLFQRSEMKSTIDLLTNLSSIIDKITKSLGLFGTLSLGAGLFAGFKNVGFITTANNELNIFRKSISSIKQNLASGQGLSSVFGSAISTNDLNAMSQYTELLKQGKPTGQAWAQTMTSASTAAKQNVLQCKNNVAALEEMTVAQKASTAASKTGTVALKAFAMAGNMIIFLVITKVIEGAAWAIDQYVNRVEHAKEAMSDARSNFDSVKSELEGINNELDNNKIRISELNGLPSLTYVEQGELDKLKEVTKELERQKDIKNIELKRSAEDLSKKNQSAFNKEYGDDNFSIEDVNLFSEVDTSALTLAQGGLEGLAAAIIKVRQAQADASNTGDDEWINNMVAAESEYKKQLEDNLSTLQGYRDNLTEILNYRSLTKDEQSFYDNLEQGIRLIYQFTDPSAWNQIEFDQIFNDESLGVTKDKLIELAQAGKLDENSIKQYSNLNDAISQTDLILGDGETAVQSFIKQIIALSNESKSTGEAVKQSFTKEDVISNINSLSEGFESLDKIMSSMKGENHFDYALLDDKNFKAQFGELGDAYTDFVEKVSSSPKDIKANQSAFDDLITVWINSSDALTNLTDDNANLTTAMLKNMGVTNAEEIVTNRLAIAHEKLAAEKYYNENASDSLKDKTMSEIDAFVNEGVAAGVSQQAMSLLALEKLSVNDIKIDTASDIDQVIALANAAGASTSALEQLARAKSAFASINSAIAKGTAQLANPSLGSPVAAGITMAAEMLKSNTMAELSEAQKTLEGISNGTYDFGVNLNPDNFKKATYSGPKASNAGGSDKDKSKKDYSEIFDWVATSIDRSDEKVESIQDKITNTSNWKPKNALTDTAIDEMSGKLTALQLQEEAYQKMADSYDLSPTYIDKIKNGTMEIETITDEAIGNNIKSYQEWYNKAEDVRKKIDDTKRSMQELAKSRLDNIINDFESLVSLSEKYSSFSKSLLELQKDLGEEISNADYENLISQQKGIYSQLENEYNSLSKELSKAVSSDAIKAGTEEWRKYREELISINSEMNDTVSSMNDFRQAMIDMSFKGIEDFADAVDRINSSINTMSDLIGDEGLIDKGMITSKGLAKIALLGQQLANAKQGAAEYANAINDVKEAYADGSLTQDEYNQRLKTLEQSQLDSVKATKDAETAILQFRKDAIQAQIDDMNDLVSAKRAAMEAEEEYQKYLESISEKQGDINNLQAKINELSLSSDRQDIAQRLQLEKQLSDAKKELADTQADYSHNQQLDALDKEAENYENARNEELDELENNYDKQQKVISDYLSDVKNNYGTVYKTLTEYGENYNLATTDDLTSPWESASGAVDTFQSAVSDAISQINIDIASIDLSSLTELVSMMQGVSGGSSGSGFEDVTGSGTWQKTSKGDWYGSSNDDYVSDGIYTIGGKQYSFNEDGYLKTGWDESSGDWRYFEPENGQMVKSTWRNDKDGKQYYLKSDGTMATDMAIKDKSDSNKYYYVGSDGVYAGKELTYEQVKKQNIEVGYKNGTLSAKSGLAHIYEDGVGSELLMDNVGTIKQMEGGEVVFNSGMTKTLWDFADSPRGYIANALASNLPTLDSTKFTPNGNSIMLNITSPLVTIEGGLDSTMKDYVTDLVNGIPGKIVDQMNSAYKTKGTQR